MTVIVGASYYRAHGLGNDYLVFEAAAGEAAGEGAGGSLGPGWCLTPEAVQRICHRWEGVGSDGIVILLQRAPRDGIFPLRMFNPDGSEFERSGNGLRVLGAHLHSSGLVEGAPFQVRSGGSAIGMQVHGRGPEGILDLSVQMGRARLGAAAVELEMAGSRGEAGAPGGGGGPEHATLHHPTAGPVTFVPVSVGNPHAVVFTQDLSPGALETLGPFLATHPAFARGTNVQLARVEGDPAAPHLRIAIWERGVGRTSASGTSSCAATVAAVATGRLPPGRVAVAMEGGTLEVTVTPEGDVTLRGPVQEVCRGTLTEGFLAWLGRDDR